MAERAAAEETITDVRAQTRQRLLKLRQDRLSRRRQRAPDQSAPGADTAEAFEIDREADATAALDDAVEDEPLSEAENEVDDTEDAFDPAEASDEAPDGIDEDPEEPEAGIDADANEDVEAGEEDTAPVEAVAIDTEEATDAEPSPPSPDTEAGDDTDAALSEEAGTGVSDDDPNPDAQDPDGVDERSDLFELPGAGPGLVWMLQTSGINTMADLAEADAELLLEKLGLVGEILNIGFWTDHAKSEVARQSDPEPN